MSGDPVKWYKFTLATDIQMSSLRYLNVGINTAGTTAGMLTELGVYDCQGTLMGTDYNSAGELSALSFGSGNATQAGTGAWNNGRHGRLPAGVYYLAVTQYNSPFALTAWGATGGAGLSGVASMTLNFGVATAPTPPAGAISLGVMSETDTRNRVGDTLATGQVRWYIVNVPASNRFPSRFLDIDTEGSSLTGTNSTRIAVYNRTGVITGTQWYFNKENNQTALADLSDGNNNLSQITLGAGTRPAVGFGLPYNGRDGDLQAGVYYIAVAGPGNTPASSGFGFTSSSTATGTINLNIATGIGQVALQGVGTSLPPRVDNGGTATALLRVSAIAATTPLPVSTLITVTANLTGINLSASQPFYDDGTHGDATPGDLIYSCAVTIPATVTTGTKSLPFSIADAQGRTNTGSIPIIIYQPPPANDLCANATPVGTGTTPFDTTWANRNALSTNCGASAPEVYFSFTPAITGTYRLDTCGSSFDTLLAVFSSCSASSLMVCTDGAEPQCPSSPNHAALSVTLTAGVPYIIQAGGGPSGQGSGLLTITSPPVALAVAGSPIITPELSTAVLSATVTQGFPPLSSGIAVQVDLTSAGGPLSQVMYDDGTHGDVTPNDLVYSVAYPLPLSAPTGDFNLPVSCSDAQARSASGSIYLTVTHGPSGGCCVGGSCSLQRHTMCAAGGGSYLGDHTPCRDTYTISPSVGTFEDISATGTLLTQVSAGDDSQQSRELPFPFQYLGTTYTGVAICANGFLQFGALTNCSFDNVAIPSRSTPNAILAPLWDDLDLTGAGAVYFLDDSANDRVIFSWQNCPQWGGSDANNFQIILYRAGGVEFRYGVVSAILAPSPLGDTVTVGYEDQSGDTGGTIDPLTLVAGGNASFLLVPTSIAPCGPQCDSTDFNGDGLYPDTADIDDFLSVFSGGTCSTGTCADLDFNNDGLFPDTADFDSLLSVFSGGSCL